MEIFVKIENLFEVFVLHALSSGNLFVYPLRICRFHDCGGINMIDNYIMYIDAKLANS